MDKSKQKLSKRERTAQTLKKLFMIYLANADNYDRQKIIRYITRMNNNDKNNKYNLTEMYLKHSKKVSIEVMRFLRKLKRGDINKQNEDGDTPLHIYLKKFHKNLSCRVVVYLSNKENIKIQNKNGMNPLMIYCTNVNKKIDIHILKRLTTQYTLNQVDNSKNTAVHILFDRVDCMNFSMSCVNKLITDKNKYMVNKSGESLLSILVQRDIEGLYCCNRELLDNLISEEILNYKDVDGNTPLMNYLMTTCIDEYDVNIFRLLISNDNLYIANNLGKLPISIYKELDKNQMEKDVHDMLDLDFDKYVKNCYDEYFNN